MDFLHQALIYLSAAVLAVLVFSRLGLGSVLGYLVAGAIIGPAGLGLIGDVAGVLHFAELGVVLLLFLIGLELQPARLWGMRRLVFGLGSAQLLLTTAALAVPALLLGLPPPQALLVGAGLSLSSTAMALQLLAERNQLPTEHGRGTFGVLLFQDLAVIPLLAAVPFLGDGPAHPAPGWQGVLKLFSVLAAVGLSKFALKPLFRVVARQQSGELFTATALLVVVGTAVGFGAVGLSMALGAFLAGVLLAESQYRHELEADIAPFKGLLLGLFFVAVGMSVRLDLVASRPWLTGLSVLGLVLIKAAVLFGVGRAGGRGAAAAARIALAVSQGGEFAFVLFRQALGAGAMDADLADLLVAVVSLSMATTPPLYAALEWALRRGSRAGKPRFDVSPQHDSPVVIAGFGRVGQVVGRMLRAKGIPFTALDNSPDHIDFLRGFGGEVFYGDAGRLDMLRSARLEQARLFVLAIDDPDASVRCAQLVQQNFPHVTLVARARNRDHAYRLMALDIGLVFRETWASSLEMTAEVLQALGLTYSDSHSSLERFREHDEALMDRTFRFRDDQQKLRQLATAARHELRSLFEQDDVSR